MASQTLAASKRLRKELQVLRKSQTKNDDIFLHNNPDNLLLWKAWIRGPDDTAYQGGVFQLDIRCGMDYPLSPPTIKFVTKVGWFLLIIVCVCENTGGRKQMSLAAAFCAFRGVNHTCRWCSSFLAVFFLI